MSASLAEKNDSGRGRSVTWLARFVQSVVIGIAFFQASAAGRLDLLKSFGFGELSGTEPLTALVEGSEGMLYGTTSKGGPDSAPTIFEISKTGSDYKVLLALPGALSVSALSEGTDGQLYATKSGTLGTNAADRTYGTVFRLAKNGSDVRMLHTFYQETTTTEGASPRAGVLPLEDGMLYGTASSGGISNCGTIFRLRNDGVAFEVLHQFKGDAVGDGASPRGALIKGSDGRLYGTTYSGGTGGYGTIFRINRDGSEYAVLCHLIYGANLAVRPSSALLEGTDGALYGSTDNEVFKLNKDGSGLAVLLSGIAPRGIVAGADARLYGTSNFGGTANYGTIFSLQTDGTDLRILHSFLRLYGSGLAAPILGSDGVLYGVNRYGGTAETGELFRIDTEGTAFATLHSFTQCGSDGRNPCGELIHASDGSFYGTTCYGGVYERGTVFKLDPRGASVVLHHFGAGTNDGSSPTAALLEGKDGVLYGTTSSGGGGYYPGGTVFKLNKDGSDYAVLYCFQRSGSLPWEPEAGLIDGQDGLLYGTTLYGGATNLGTVFKLAKNGSAFSVIHSFLGSPNSDGSEPRGGLVQASDGTLYGCTYRGSTTPVLPMYIGDGTIFKLATNGADYVVLRSFDYFGGDAARPLQLIEGRDGVLYGITDSLNVAGGTSNTNIDGVVFTVNKDGSGYRVLHAFGAVTNDGIGPSSLAEDPTGTLYGTTTSGGTKHLGVVFRLQKDGNAYGALVSFTDAGSTGTLLPCGLTLGSDGAFYGVTVLGGEMDSGTVFRFLPPEFPQMLAVAPGAKPTVSFSGAPGIQYELRRSTDLHSWSVIATLTMPAGGVCTYQDMTAPDAGAFYRARWRQ